VGELVKLVSACDENQFFDLGVRDTTLSIPLQKWHSGCGRVVILGDSAHAMPPFLGQGANQALQDGFVLARGIRKINEKEGQEWAKNMPFMDGSTALQSLMKVSLAIALCWWYLVSCGVVS